LRNKLTVVSLGLLLEFWLGLVDAPRVRVSTTPLSVEKGASALLGCEVDAKPAVSNVRWLRNGRFIATTFNHTLRSVDLDDDGVYTCAADNGLGRVGEAQLQLDVLFAPHVRSPSFLPSFLPSFCCHLVAGELTLSFGVDFGDGQVTVESRREVDLGAVVVVACNVSSKPAPASVEWLKEGDAEFRAAGDLLRLNRVAAADAGRYVCRAVNVIGGAERQGNATFQVKTSLQPNLT